MAKAPGQKTTRFHIHSWKYPILLFVICFVVFLPFLFNGFALDDYPQIVTKSYVHNSANALSFFTASIGPSDKNGSFFDTYYRPIQFQSYTLLYALGNGQPLLFHLFQISLFSIIVLFVWFFLSSFYRKDVSFFLTLVFLIHPDNNEIVAYIAAFPDVLFFFFGMLALIILQFSKKSLKTLVYSSFFLLLSLLSKETGVLFVCIAFLYAAMFRGYSIKIASIVFLSFLPYLILRMLASYHHLFALTSRNELHMTLFTRIALAPQIFFFYLKDIFMPTPIIPTIDAFSPNFSNNIIPFAVISILSILTLLFGYYLYRLKTNQLKVFLFFLFWFIAGISFHLQIVPFDVIVAKRWVIFPLLGFLGMIGLTTHYLKIISKPWKTLLFFSFFILIFLFLLYTIRLHFYWKGLYKHTLPPYYSELER